MQYSFYNRQTGSFGIGSAGEVAGRVSSDPKLKGELERMEKGDCLRIDLENVTIIAIGAMVTREGLRRKYLEVLPE